MCLEPYISDHAVLRYLERVHGIDVEAIRKTMMSPAVHAAVMIGGDTVKLSSGARLKLQGHVVQTVLSREMAERDNRRVR
jgi:hypothetical protein